MANKLFIVRLFIVFDLLLFSKFSFPQFDDAKFEHITVEDGLPENSVTRILQDHLGFLWLGTQNGLVKYDGYTMTVYRSEPDDSTSISGNGIWAMCEDHNGNIWIGAGPLWTIGSGLNRFNRKTETFIHYLHNPSDSSSINSNTIRAVYEDKSNRLWIGTNKGLNLFDEKNNQFYHFYFHDSSDLRAGVILSINEDPLTGDILVGSSIPGLWKCDLNNSVLLKYDIIDDDQVLNTARITSLQNNKNNLLWMGTTSGLGRLNLITKKFTLYKLISDEEYNSANRGEVPTILRDKKDQIWFGSTIGGLIKFDPRTENFKRYNFEGDNPLSLQSNSIWSIYEDPTGILWVGTHKGGLNKWDQNKWKFKHFFNIPNNQNNISNNNVRSICEDEYGIIWLGTSEGGLNRYDGNNNQYTRYLNNPLNNRSLISDEIECVIVDPLNNGVLWIGTTANGLDRFDQETGIFKHFQNNPKDVNSISYHSIRTLFIDSKGTLWAGTWGNGLDRFDRRTRTFTRFQYDYEDTTTISENFISVIYEDRKGKLWIGTDGYGVNLFNQKTEKFTRYVSLAKEGKPEIITCIFESKAGDFWIGTLKNGIYLFDRDKGYATKNFTEKNGLANNLVSAILEDDSGNLWISTATGLSKFNTQNETFKNFRSTDGLGGIRFNRRSAIKIKSGEMIFGGEHGFNIFHPDSIKDDPFPPRVLIENVSLFNRPTEKLLFEKYIAELDQIKLSYDQNDLRFDYVGLHFSEPNSHKYKYILEGFDEDWIDAGTQRNATYTNLDPGKYRFRVTASNKDGVWNEVGASINIIISPPLWATMWAYIIYAIIILCIIYFTWKYQLKRVKIKHDYEMSKFEAKKMHEVDEMKNRFFTNISHEFRTPLTLIFGPAKDIAEETKETKTKQNAGIIKRNASRLYRLVNQLLELSTLEAGKMKLQASEQNIMPLLKGLVLSFSSLADRKNITLNFNTIEQNLKVFIDREKVEKVINNLLSNAFNFTPEGGRIDVTVEKLIKKAEIRISDNGVGIPKERINKIFDRFYQVDGSRTRESEGTGIGLALTKELVGLHKGKIRVESNEGEGTTFTVLLPLGKEHLNADEIVEKKSQEETAETLVESELIPKTESRKETTDVDILVETDKPLLLIVEDNLDVRKYIIDHLESDYRIQEAVDGEEGLAQALNHIPDLIISDVMMPKIDGFELCNKLKTDEKTSHIPIIMLTAKATSEDKIEGYETGADDYIMKPFDANELKARIKNLIEIRRNLQKKFSENNYSIPKELSSIDERFLKNILGVINDHISEENFSIESLSKESAMSKEQIYKKLKALTGKSPSLFLRSIRLVKAKKLIKEQTGTISEISYQVGFNSPAYFTKCFKEEFRCSPSELLK